MFDIFHDLTIDASPATVFAAVAEPTKLVNWWPLKCEGTPTEGASYNFYFGSEYNWFGKVQKYQLNHAFHIKMTKSDQDWDPTTFGFDLEAKGDATLLKFWHKGWPEENHHYRHSSFCWAILLKGLKDYVEKGTVIPFEHRS